MSIKDNFISFYFNTLRAHHMFATMGKTVEDSPWHREASVAVHTDMVVTQYIAQMGQYKWGHNVIIGALACAFHDWGKPQAEETRTSAERGTYRRYAGHEQISARRWEEYAVKHWELLQELFELTPLDVYRVGWIIQNHLPFGIKKPQKRLALAKTVNEMITAKVFNTCLKADCWGRISDDHDQKKEDVIKWTEDFLCECINVQHAQAQEVPERTCYILIGASGSGKSTFTGKMIVANTEGTTAVHSLDLLRMAKFAPNSTNMKADYHKAFEASCNDKSFKQECNRDFIDLVSNTSNDVVFVDNTSVSVKSRNFYTTEARKRGMKVVGVLFPTTPDILRERQATRHDKTVPIPAVVRQYQSIQYPSLGEVDEVLVMLK